MTRVMVSSEVARLRPLFVFLLVVVFMCSLWSWFLTAMWTLFKLNIPIAGPWIAIREMAIRPSVW